MENAAQLSVWPMLLATVATAFGIERLIELMWNFAEWIMLGVRRQRPADLKTAAYLQFKSGVSVLLSAILGVFFANILNLHFFAALQQIASGFTLDVPANWDVVVTGLIIGVTAKPIHDLIELLAELKNFMSNAAVRQREAAGAAMADGVLKLAQSEAESMLEVPGLGRTSLTEDLGTKPDGTAGQSPTDKYIEVLHNRTLT